MIREASNGDAGVVADLWTEAYVTMGVGGRSEPYATGDFSDSARQGEVFVAEDAGVVVGAVVLFPPETPGRVIADPGEAELSRLAVALPVRRSGIGRALARHCERRAQVADWDAIVLWSRPAQTAAHRLYESHGYRRVPERDSVDEGGHARWVFRLPLT